MYSKNPTLLEILIAKIRYKLTGKLTVIKRTINIHVIQEAEPITYVAVEFKIEENKDA